MSRANYPFSANKRRIWDGGFEFIVSQGISFKTNPLNAGTGTPIAALRLKEGDLVKMVWVDVVQACPSLSTIDVGNAVVTNYWGNALRLDSTGQCAYMLSATKPWDFDSIAKGESDVCEVEVPNAVPGDSVTAYASAYTNELRLSCQVIAKDHVEVTATNLAPDIVIKPGELTYTVIVNKAPMALAPYLVTTSALDVELRATTDLMDVDITSGAIVVYADVIRTRA